MRKPRVTDARSVALVVLRALEDDGAFLQPALDSAVSRAKLDQRDRRLAWSIVLGTARWLSQLDDAIQQNLRGRTLDKIEPDILMILRLSAYQILFMDRVPGRAIVHSAVDLGRRFVGPRATGFINGLLRNLIRSGYEPDTGANVSAVSTRLGHPEWLVSHYVEQSDMETAIARCEANNQPAPLTIRLKRGEHEAAIEALKNEGAELEACLYAPDGYQLINHPNPFGSQSFQAGNWTVQDEGSQLVVEMLDPKPGDSIWDMCAAPGGKTHYIWDRIGHNGSLLASDCHGEKVAALKQRFDGSEVEIRVHDGEDRLDTQFDRVLLDAPCTALGLVRRHPEIRWRRRLDDIGNTVDLQWRLLLNGAHHVKPDGLLVYSVCSDLPQEGAQQISRFLEACPDFVLEAPTTGLDWSSVTRDDQLNVDPLRHGCDGFFAARLRRRSV